MSNRKGDRLERDCARKAYDLGAAVMRAPASGAATERELPDLLIGFGHRAFAGEHKASSGDPIYVSKREIVDLAWFARMFGFDPVVITRWDQDVTWYFHDPNDLHDAGESYRIRKENRKATSIGTLETFAN